MITPNEKITLKLLNNIESIKDLSNIVSQFQENSEFIFTELVRNNKIISICNNFEEFELICNLFNTNQQLEIIFDLFNADYKLFDWIKYPNDIKFCLEKFENKGTALAVTLYNILASDIKPFLSDDFPNNEYFIPTVKFMIKNLSEYNERIWNLVFKRLNEGAADWRANKIRCFIKAFPEKKENIFREYISQTKLFKTETYKANSSEINSNILMEKLMLSVEFPEQFSAMLKDFNLINPIMLTPEQTNPDCGFVAFSAITKHFALKENNSSLFFSVKNDGTSTNQSLRKLGREIAKISGPGAIFSLGEFMRLIQATNFCTKVLHIPNKEQFINCVRELIDIKIPIILPYDPMGTHGASAHYAAVCGYKSDKDNNMMLILTHRGSYELKSVEEIFYLNNDLYTSSVSTFVKISKKEFYNQVSNDTKDEFYKKYQYPQFDLTATLKNRILIVYTPQMKKTLIDSGILAQIEPFIEVHPSELKCKSSNLI